MAATLSRAAFAWTARYVAVSEDTAGMARDVERVPLGKVQVIHNGIDLDGFPFVGTSPVRTGRRAVTVGRLDVVKDQVTLLRAVRLVVDKNPGFQLDLVGDGPSRPELETLRTALGLVVNVHFHGYRDQVGPHLAAADFFVFSSVSEGVSISLLEAMASGLPAVATDVGGNREVIVHGETGYLVPAGSPEALADAMMTIQAEPGTLERMGRAARSRVEDQFSLRRMVAQYEDLYFQCLGRTLPESTGVTDAVRSSRAG